VDTTGVLTFATASTVPVGTANKIALRAFEATRGHRASVVLGNGSFIAGGSMFLYSAYASAVSTGFAATGFMEPVDLPVTGTYGFVLDPNGTYTGSATVTLYDVPADFSAPIVADDLGGVAVSIGPNEPGRNARLTFTGAAGNRMSASTASTTLPGATLFILNPDGSPLGSVGVGAGVGFLEPLTLPSSGGYTVLLDPTDANTGDSTVNLYTVPADTSGPITINGSTVPVPLSPGQNGTLTFSGSASQLVTVHVTGNNMGIVYVKLLKNDGTTLAQYGTSAADFNLAQTTLPATPPTDTYTISIDPFQANTGSLNVGVTSP
jgi:hypothetical protein